MTATARRGPRPRVLAIIAPGDGPHLVAPAARAAAQSPPGIALHDALARCLAMLEHDPPRFQRAATTWHARWCMHLPMLTLAEAQVTLAALEALAGPDPTAGARELRRQSAHHGLRDVARVLDAWIARRDTAALVSVGALPEVRAPTTASAR